jgi:hypothetical protein
MYLSLVNSRQGSQGKRHWRKQRQLLSKGIAVVTSFFVV